MRPGAIVVVQATDPMAGIDVPHLLRETGDELLEAGRGEGILTFRIRRRAGAGRAG
jgi:tRNA 2-thiouridine synthesizing protein A